MHMNIHVFIDGTAAEAHAFHFTLTKAVCVCVYYLSAKRRVISIDTFMLTQNVCVDARRR